MSEVHIATTFCAIALRRRWRKKGKKWVILNRERESFTRTKRLRIGNKDSLAYIYLMTHNQKGLCNSRESKRQEQEIVAMTKE